MSGSVLLYVRKLRKAAQKDIFRAVREEGLEEEIKRLVARIDSYHAQQEGTPTHAEHAGRAEHADHAERAGRAEHAEHA